MRLLSVNSKAAITVQFTKNDEDSYSVRVVTEESPDVDEIVIPYPPNIKREYAKAKRQRRFQPYTKCPERPTLRPNDRTGGANQQSS